MNLWRSRKVITPTFGWSTSEPTAWFVSSEHSRPCDGDLVLYGPHMVVPSASRKSVLQRLHESQHGAETTKRWAKQIVFWPGINWDITNAVRACEACQTLLPSQQREEYRIVKFTLTELKTSGEIRYSRFECSYSFRQVRYHYLDSTFINLFLKFP